MSASKLITYNGVTQTTVAWAKQIGMRVDSLQVRLQKWGVDKALSVPPRPIFRMITFKGVTKAIFEWAKELGIARTTLVTRIEQWGIDKALTAGKPKIVEHHGMRYRSEYGVWSGMKQRCYNPNHDGYENYGGRGITICGDWLNSFSKFYEDMGPRPSLDYEIDRIDNDGNYERGNCQWVLTERQRSNVRSNRRIEFLGELLTLAEWAKRFGLRHNTLSYRLDHGWSIESALTVPVPWFGGRR